MFEKSISFHNFGCWGQVWCVSQNLSSKYFGFLSLKFQKSRFLFQNFGFTGSKYQKSQFLCNNFGFLRLKSPKSQFFVNILVSRVKTEVLCQTSEKSCIWSKCVKILVFWGRNIRLVNFYVKILVSPVKTVNFSVKYQKSHLFG